MNSYSKPISVRQGDLATLELMWAASFPSFPCPEEKYLRGWLNTQHVSIVCSAIEHASQSHERFQNGAHAGRVVSILLRNVRFAE